MEELEWHIRPHGENYDVILFGKSPDQKIEDLAAGISRFGGSSRMPNYMMAYYHAAGILIKHGVNNDELDEIGLPVFYLQRHTVELMLKRLLRWLHDLADLRSTNEENLIYPSSDQKKHLNGSHDLGELLKDLINLSNQMGYGEPPLEIQDFVTLIDKIEMNPQWSRYSHSRVKPNCETVQHVATEIVVPIVDFQVKLKDLIANALHNYGGENNYESYLYYAWEEAMQAPQMCKRDAQ